MQQSSNLKKIKKCVLFVVPGNRQVLIGMPDATSLNIVKVNIDSIQVEIVVCKTSNKQKTQSGAKGYTNMDLDTINKQDTNGQKTKSQQRSHLIISFPQITQMQIKKKQQNDPENT